MKMNLSKQLPIAALLATCLAIPAQAAEAAQPGNVIQVSATDRSKHEADSQAISLALVGLKSDLVRPEVFGESDFQRLSTSGPGLSEQRKLQLDNLTDTLARRYVDKHFDDNGQKRSDVSQAVQVAGAGVLLTISADGTLSGDLAPDESDYVVLALPIAAVLLLVARVGIQAAIKRWGGWIVQKCARAYLLKRNRNKWNHILQEKHNWRLKTPSHDKSKVASVMAKAYRHGKHRDHGSPDGGVDVEWDYEGHTIIVTYYKDRGDISNGYVKRKR